MDSIRFIFLKSGVGVITTPDLMWMATNVGEDRRKYRGLGKSYAEGSGFKYNR